jgi:hypothetical protein
MQMASLEIKSSFGDSHSFTYVDSVISDDAYLIGSMAGGTGTEQKSEIKGAKVEKLLKHYGAETVEALFATIDGGTQEEKDDFLKVISKLEKITFIWSETDWSDEK